MKTSTYLLTLPLLLSLVACNDSGGGSDLAQSFANSNLEEVLDDLENLPAADEIAGNTQAPEETDQNGAQEGEQDSENTLPAGESKYKFSLFDGKCKDEQGVEGLNDNVFAECGDLSNQNLSDLDFGKKNYWKLNLEGSYIENSKIKIGKIAKYEVDYDENTMFAGVKNFFTKLFNSHISKMEDQKSSMKKSNDKVASIKKKMMELMKQYDQTEDEKLKKKLAKQLKKQKKQLEKHKGKAQLAMNRMYRHQNLSSKAYELASDDPQMLNPKVKNKKWLSVDSKAIV